MAHAATIQVTSNLDDGTGCTLREAVSNASFDNDGGPNGCTAGSGDDTITFAPAVTGTIGLSSAIQVGPGGPSDNGTTTIQGPGSGTLNLSGLGLTRVLKVPLYNDDPTAQQNAVTVSGVQISGAVVSANNTTGGAISSDGDLTLDHVTVDGNSILTSGTGHRSAFGGGLYSVGPSLTITDSTFTNNHAITNSTDTSGDDSQGGALFLSGDTVTIRNSTFAFNTTEATGGAPGQERSRGGAIYTQAHTTMITNTTISNNISNSNTWNLGAYGGGVYTDAANLGDTATLASDTITDNVNEFNGLAATSGLPVNVLGDSTVPDIQNTVIGQHLGGVNCGGPNGGGGGVNSLGHNYADDATCDPDVPNGDVSNGDVFNALEPLANNGGPTLTRIPKPYVDGNPTVIDQGITPTGANTDQRGRPRPWFWSVPNSSAPGSDGADIGAVEVQGVFSFSSNPASDDPSPVISGDADVVGKVQLYGTNGCTGTLLGPQTDAADFGSPGITIGPLGPNTSTPITALASYGEANSTCTGLPVGVTYKVKPVAPTIVGTNPGSSSNNNNPAILGSSLPGTTVSVYTNASCTGAPAGTGTAVSFPAGVTVSVPDNSTTTFYANASGVGGTSDCSSTSATYAEVTPPPAVTPVTPVTPKKCKKGKKLKHGKCVKKKKKKK
jgi:hypothetical protein